MALRPHNVGYSKFELPFISDTGFFGALDFFEEQVSRDKVRRDNPLIEYLYPWLRDNVSGRNGVDVNYIMKVYFRV